MVTNNQQGTLRNAYNKVTLYASQIKINLDIRIMFTLKMLEYDN